MRASLWTAAVCETVLTAACQVLFDLEEKAAGSIEQAWPFPSQEHDDPNDIKPADWVDNELMPDPEDPKPGG